MVLLAIFIVVGSVIWDIIQALPDILCWLGFLLILGFIIRGIVKETSPDYVITIDALAARSTKRLGRTIQLTDTGIVPGSGVGNHRNALNLESIGVPVISIGVPTVVDAATIVSDAVNTNRDVVEDFIS